MCVFVSFIKLFYHFSLERSENHWTFDLTEKIHTYNEEFETFSNRSVVNQVLYIIINNIDDGTRSRDSIILIKLLKISILESKESLYQSYHRN